jgi:hypothetical protein
MKATFSSGLIPLRFIIIIILFIVSDPFSLSFSLYSPP